ncbi:Syntaxin-5 [Cryptotermes secundus]|uniref:Syntaxin-5 n=2 Tax=Cryptotermes secundus TaxID=105785 RepID=A0A2J7RQ66_9NEOP|nr:Syntaxin-5 [Cryptotermes secundus]
MGSTYIKLEDLTLVAKRKSLFNDRSAEIQELTRIIRCDLNSLNQQIAKLQELARNQRQSQQNAHQLLSHSSSVVLALQSKLASMSTEFQQALAVRTENLKQQKNRSNQLFPGPVSSSFPPPALAGHQKGSVLLADEVSINMEAHGPLLQVTEKQAMIDDLQSRAETMQNIESTIVELGGIFKQLAYIVKEQGETVEIIDRNVQDVQLNAEGAHTEILKYFKNITSSSWLMIKIFGVLISSFLFFVLFLA